MSTTAETEFALGQSIIVRPKHTRVEFVSAFARRCFSTGEFRARSGRRNRWLMDCRRGLGDGATTRAGATELANLADDKGICQFAGAGFGSYLLVGGILAVKGASARGALIRPRAKGYGNDQLIEGDLDEGQPVCIVDDILNSGASALDAARKLRNEGFKRLCHLAIFRFEWGRGLRRLNQVNIDCDWLATVRQVSPDPKPPSCRNSDALSATAWRWLHRVWWGDP